MNQTEVLSDEVVTRVQLIRYILDQLGGRCESLKLVKLVALSDIYKLRRDGETITKDRYVAMKNGPAPSVTANIIRFDDGWVDGSALDYAGEYIETCNTEVSAKDVPMEYDYLSDFDKECADYVVRKYGNLSAKDLIEGNGGENVHAFEAWKKHGVRDYGVGQVKQIQMEDFFENDGLVQVDEEDIQKARERHLYGDV
ncbi:MAG: Panacea domain-containing protein [Candidatus Kaiserbacteria bacterium]|nr:Panacea domain-containing protein [Candidatus Kaiserbacteria bacterium]